MESASLFTLRDNLIHVWTRLVSLGNRFHIPSATGHLLEARGSLETVAALMER